MEPNSGKPDPMSEIPWGQVAYRSGEAAMATRQPKNTRLLGACSLKFRGRNGETTPERTAIRLSARALDDAES